MDFKFINGGVTADDTKAFNKCKRGNAEKIVLSPSGLYQFWQSVSHSLFKLHKGAIGTCTSKTPSFDSRQIVGDEETTRPHSNPVNRINHRSNAHRNSRMTMDETQGSKIKQLWKRRQHHTHPQQREEEIETYFTSDYNNS